MKRIKIVFICEHPVDVRTIDALSELYEVTILTRKHMRHTFVNWEPKRKDKITLLLLPANRLLTLPSVFFWLCGSAKNYDVVFILGADLGALGAILARYLIRKPILLLVGKLSDECFMCRAKKNITSKIFHRMISLGLRLIMMVNIKFSDGAVAVGEYIAQRMNKYSDRVFTIPVYGVDSGVYRPVSLSEKINIRRMLKLPKNAYIIFFSSRISPEKDSECLVRSLKILLNNRNNITLMNLSGGYLDFKKIANKYDVGDKVIARPPVDPRVDLPLYYQASDLCVQCSKAEGLGFSPLEALACGIPVMATAIGGLKYTVIPGETGLSVPVGSPQRRAEAIEFAITHPREMYEMAKRGREMVCTRYEAKKVFSDLNIVIKRLTRSSGVR